MHAACYLFCDTCKEPYFDVQQTIPNVNHIHFMADDGVVMHLRPHAVVGSMALNSVILLAMLFFLWTATPLLLMDVPDLSAFDLHTNSSHLCMVFGIAFFAAFCLIAFAYDATNNKDWSAALWYNVRRNIMRLLSLALAAGTAISLGSVLTKTARVCATMPGTCPGPYMCSSAEWWITFLSHAAIFGFELWFASTL
jgi:hypothetical protein